MIIYENSDTVEWTLYQYVSAMERRAIEDFRKGLMVGQRVDMDVFLRALLSKRVWEYPLIDSLKGKAYRSLSELRWKSDGVPHRILGYRLSIHEYVALIGCTHNKRKYLPPTLSIQPLSERIR